MEIPIVAVLTACAGLVGFLIARVGYAARLAAATTEAALLRERVDDLEAALAQDQEAAALLAPLRDTLGRVEAQVSGLVESNRNIVNALRQIEHWIVNASKVLTAQAQAPGSGEQGQ